MLISRLNISFGMGVFIGCLFFSSLVLANEDEGLYDPLPPEGSAFVRFLNTDEMEISPILDGKHYNKLSAQTLSPYIVRPKGLSKISFGDIQTEETFEEGKFYSLIFHDNTVTILEDPVSDNRAKALLVFYNLTDHDFLTLKTANGKTEIIGNVEKAKNGSRKINAVRIGFSVYDGDKEISILEKKSLERGDAYAVIALKGEDGKAEIKFVRAYTNTTQ